jgi:hypothetical protein
LAIEVVGVHRYCLLRHGQSLSRRDGRPETPIGRFSA